MTTTLECTTVTIAGCPVEVDHEGFCQKPEQWNEDIAREIGWSRSTRCSWSRRPMGGS